MIERSRPQPHSRASHGGSTLGRWRDLLTRTLAGRLVLLLVAVGAIGLVSSAIGHFLLGAFPSYGEALWSATAHLVDPGSIGDDETAAERVVGLVQVISGIVFFAGIVLTVLTEVLDRALRRLRKGDPAVVRRAHLLIVGFNPSLEEVRELVGARFAADHPEIVVLLPLEQLSSRTAAQGALRGYPARTAVVVADLETDGFERVCAADARRIVLLSPPGDPGAADLTVAGWATLLANHLEPIDDQSPLVAFELRRGRNLGALWYEPGSAGTFGPSRFPAGFDVLVNDRNLGAVLGLAIRTPAFADQLLDSSEATAPALLSPGLAVGMSLAEARHALPGWALLGVLDGDGPTARARLLPGEEHRIGPGERLIATLRSGPLADPGPEPAYETLELQPTQPGPVLLIGWSDACRALVESLDRDGFDPGLVLHLLNPSPVAGFGEEEPGGRARLLIDGDPNEPEDIAAAIHRVGPAIVHVAAPENGEPGAIIAGLHARRLTDAPVIVEQYSGGAGAEMERITAGLTVVSTAHLLAETVAISLADPAALVAREQMVEDPEIALECLTYGGVDPLPVAHLPAVFAQANAVPLAVLPDGDERAELRAGDRILVLRRVEPAPVGS